MATVFFKLKDPSAKIPTTIYLILSFGQETIKISTGTKIHPKDWNQSGQCMRSTQRNAIADVLNFNHDLTSHSARALNCYRSHLTANEKVIIEKLKYELKEVIRPKGEKTPEKINFLQCAQDCYNSCTKSPHTKKHYLTALNILKKFETSTGKKLQFEDINMAFYTDFVDWAENKSRNKIKAYSKNTIGSFIKEIKVFMNYAIDNGLTDCTGHLHRKFVTMEETSDSIYLSVDEINKLYKLKFINKSLDRVRDLFIIGCWTGLRYADLTQITPDKFVKNGSMLRIKTEKTGETVVIPLHPFIKEIIDKRDGHAPEAYEDQPMNRWLKIIARLAGFTEKVSKTITRGGKAVTKSHFKWELVMVHTARRSFATNAYIAGVPSISIMKITGHRTEKSFLKYIKISAEENAELLKSHKFFQLKAV